MALNDTKMIKKYNSVNIKIAKMKSVAFFSHKVDFSDTFPAFSLKSLYLPFKQSSTRPKSFFSYLLFLLLNPQNPNIHKNEEDENFDGKYIEQ
jgi:hypothetical protein